MKIAQEYVFFFLQIDKDFHLPPFLGRFLFQWMSSQANIYIINKYKKYTKKKNIKPPHTHTHTHTHTH